MPLDTDEFLAAGSEALRCMPAGVVRLDGEVLDYANPAALSILEADEDAQVLGQPALDFVHILDRARLSVLLRRIGRQDGAKPGVECQIRTCRGNLRAVTMSSAAGDGADGAAWIVFMDITRRRLNTHLQETERNIRRLFANTTDIYYRIDAEGKVLMASPAVERVLGYRPEEVVGRDSTVFYADPGERQALLEKLAADGHVSDYHVRLVGKDGGLVDVSFSSHALFDDEGNYIAVEGVMRDITERVTLERLLRQLAATDELTGIANRRTFLERATQALRRWQRHRQPLALLIVDLDWFKRINDRHGHLYGDEVLKRFTDTVRTELREIDIFGRLGGEEFCVVLERCGVHEATEAAERIRARVETMELTAPDRSRLHLTVSIGATCVQPSDRRIEELLSRADAALYAAKQSGRNRQEWAPDVDVQNA
jgi:diguanylate cyclase (GGDEF)-like protein/PAS domain S-box-containing protein